MHMHFSPPLLATAVFTATVSAVLTMPPLTSPSSSDCCARLNQNIIKLEERIYILYQLREEEHLLDSLVTMGPAELNHPVS